MKNESYSWSQLTDWDKERIDQKITQFRNSEQSFLESDNILLQMFSLTLALCSFYFFVIVSIK